VIHIKKILLLGNTGKIGLALDEIFNKDYKIIGKNSKDFDAEDLSGIRNIIKETKPNIVINTVAFMSVLPCQKNPEKAFRINALFPRHLAELSVKKDFLLIHFSTAAVFDNSKEEPYIESDPARPINVYGATKYCGDCFVKSKGKRYYIFRLPIVFGKAIKKKQFVERMLEKVRNKETTLRIATDVIDTPSYSKDIARTVKEVIEDDLAFGLYHTANQGQASLFELINEIIKNLNIDVKVEKASYKDFDDCNEKNIKSALASEKLKPLRSWKNALKEYCKEI